MNSLSEDVREVFGSSDVVSTRMVDYLINNGYRVSFPVGRTASSTHLVLARRIRELHRFDPETWLPHLIKLKVKQEKSEKSVVVIELRRSILHIAFLLTFYISIFLTVFGIILLNQSQKPVTIDNLNANYSVHILTAVAVAILFYVVLRMLFSELNYVSKAEAFLDQIYEYFSVEHSLKSFTKQRSEDIFCLKEAIVNGIMPIIICGGIALLYFPFNSIILVSGLLVVLLLVSLYKIRKFHIGIINVPLALIIILILSAYIILPIAIIDYLDLAEHALDMQYSRTKLVPAYMITFAYDIQIVLILVFLLIQIPGLVAIYSIIDNVIVFLDKWRNQIHIEQIPSLGTRLYSYVFIGLVWLFCSCFNLVIIFLVLSLFEYQLFGENIVLRSNVLEEFRSTFVGLAKHWHPDAIQGNLEGGGLGTKWAGAEALEYGKVMWALFLVIYCVPPMLLFCGLAYKNLLIMYRYFRLRRIAWKSRQLSEFRPIEMIMSRLEHEIRIKSPIVGIVASDALSAEVITPRLPLFRELILLSRGALKKLDVAELEALIAHEYGHLNAKHTMYFGILDFLSAWTFLGEGYVTWLLFNPFTIEDEADKFAVDYLERTRKYSDGRELLNSSLVMFEQEAIKAVGEDINHYNLAAITSGGVDWLPTRLRGDFSRRLKLSFLGKIWLRVRLFFFMYYNGWLANYMHRPFSERIIKIREY